MRVCITSPKASEPNTIHPILFCLSLSYSRHFKTNLAESIDIQNIATIEHEGRLGHALVDTVPVKFGKALPFGADHHGMCAFGSLVRVFFKLHLVEYVLQVALGIGDGLRVGHDRLCMFGEQVADYEICWAFAGIAGICLEGETEYGNLLASNRIERALAKKAGSRERSLSVASMKD